MRDKLCDEKDLKENIEYNIEFIEETIQEIEETKEDIKNNIERHNISNELRLSGRYSMMFDYYLENIQCKYSLGEPVESIIEDYKEGVYYLSSTDEEKGFIDFYWMISIGIMLEVEKEDFEALYKAVKKSHYENDYVIQYLLSAVGVIEKVTSYELDKKLPYIHLREIIEKAETSKEEASKLLIEYGKKKWLDGHKDFGWHRMKEIGNYMGLWSFEAGAIAKILGLEDEELKECNHYPYDLRHYKNGMKFYEVEVEAEEEKEKEKAKGQYSPIIPDMYYEEVMEYIKDYRELKEEEFYKKYEEHIKGIWFTVEEYKKWNKGGKKEGFLIVNYLVDKEVILQLDYKEEIEDYIETIESIWESKEIKLVNYDLENDQNYYMYVLKKAPLELYEVKMKEVKV